MGLEESFGIVEADVKDSTQTKTVCLHTFVDMSHISPTIFVYLLTKCYKCGTRTATVKFRAFQLQLLQILNNSPQPGPASFVVKCVYVFSILGHPHTDFFSDLVISALCRLQTFQIIKSDFTKAQSLAVQLFLDATAGLVIHGVHVLVKLLETFDVRLLHIAKALCGLEVNDYSLQVAKNHIQSYVDGLKGKKWSLHAVTLLERFSVRLSDQSFLLRILQQREFKPAEKWATFMGRPMLCVLVKKYIDMKMLRNAYEIIKKHGLQQEFPDAYYMCKKSSLKTQAEKSRWAIAEANTHGDKQLLEYLVYLAMEAGYSEKVDELCKRYSLRGFLNIKESDVNLSSPIQNQYLNLNQLAFDQIIWVDEFDGLVRATSHIERCKIIGVDCEWKPNYEKHSKPNKVSIIQIAGEKVVFIMDLIKLSVDEPNALNSSLKCIFQSPSILKIGYNLHGDLKHLSHSYADLECFKRYEMLLDIQNVFKEPSGGLSGLVKKMLGVGLNKARCISNWEERPLSQSQMEYAALDAAVLVQLFRHIHDRTQPFGGDDKGTRTEWRSNIVSHIDGKKKKITKKKIMKKKKPKSEKTQK